MRQGRMGNPRTGTRSLAESLPVAQGLRELRVAAGLEQGLLRVQCCLSAWTLNQVWDGNLQLANISLQASCT